MSEESSNGRRKRSPYTDNSNTVFVEFTDRGAPLDEARERKGRPPRSPSLPPLDESKPESEQPPAAQ
ncbi:hypothetical protein FTUN_2749 [Frigoriglobus tundricola]|uniref:Uncharacterized protein n=1 Tax=Frigoriglobus tundricola TaxID=2774151 RepID=A0A6M5YMC4_9BACT|nr:hypothetical protein FTUN_2749 [Frigoriglobus tundricola]